MCCNPSRLVQSGDGLAQSKRGQPDVSESLNKQGLTVMYRNPQELLALMRGESVRWAEVVKAKNLVGE